MKRANTNFTPGCTIPLRGIALFFFFLFTPAVYSAEDADRLEKLFEHTEDPKSEIGSVLPTPTRQAVTDDLSQETFTPETIVVSGSTIYTDRDLAHIYRAYLHRPTTLGRLQRLREDIIRKYQTDNYPYTQVVIEPPDEAGGAVRVIIREAYIDVVHIDVLMEGAAKDKRGHFLKLAERIKGMRPLDKPTLERYLLLAKDLMMGGGAIRTTIQPSRENSGAHTLTLHIEPGKVLSGFASLNNRGTDAVGPILFVPGVVVANPFGYLSKTQILMATTPDAKELRHLSAKHEFPLNSRGTTLELKASFTLSHPGTSEAKAVDASSRAQTFSFGVSHPFIRTQRTNLTAYGKFDIKQADRRMHASIFDYADQHGPHFTDIDGKYAEDKMRILRAGADFDYADSTDGITRLRLEWSRGLSGFGAQAHDPLTGGMSFLAKNDDGVVDFNKVTYSLSRKQPLALVSPKLEKWSVYGAIEGQLSADPLLASEECGIGGRYVGRAYDSSEITGENCISASVELRRDIGPSPIALLPASQGYLFYDIGKAEQKGSPVNQTDESLSSFGAGLTFQIPPYVSLSLEVAKPLTREVANEKDKGIRTFASIFAVF